MNKKEPLFLTKKDLSDIVKEYNKKYNKEYDLGIISLSYVWAATVIAIIIFSVYALISLIVGLVCVLLDFILYKLYKGLIKTYEKVKKLWEK